MMLLPAIVLIESQQPGNTAIGTGFVIGHAGESSYILTCAHVVRDMGGPEQIKAATFPAELIVIGEDSGLDLAVLRVTQLKGRPPRSLRTGGSPGQAVTIEGHSKYIQYRPLETLNGRIIRSFMLSDTRQEHYVPAWYITIDDREKLLGGYSGSPVCDTITGAVIGVMITSDGERQGRAISIDALPHIWPEMPLELLSAVPLMQANDPQEPVKPEATPALADLSQGVNVYLAAHRSLNGVASGRQGEHIIDWTRDFVGDDPPPEVWERQLIRDLQRVQVTLRHEHKSLIQLRAFARNSAALAFGSIFCQRAGFQIHYTDNRSAAWRTDEPTLVASPLTRIDTRMSETGRDLVLELAVTTVARNVRELVDVWLGATSNTPEATAPPAQSQSHRAAFRQMLVTFFSDSELRDLCFDLGIEYENLSGQSKSDKVRELIAYAERSGRSIELLSLCRHLRPEMAWDGLSQPSAVGQPRTAMMHKRILLDLERENQVITPAEGAAIARQVCDLIGHEGRPGGTVHLFGALPMGVLLLIGWGLKAGRTIQFYDLNTKQHYQPTCLLTS